MDRVFCPGSGWKAGARGGEGVPVSWDRIPERDVYVSEGSDRINRSLAEVFELRGELG
jgi:hypothetical protein